MTSLVSKKKQEAAARKEIAKRRQLLDESKSESSSGSEVHYNITSSDESLVRTTRAKSNDQEAAVTTTSPPQSNEGSDEAESDGDKPLSDNARKGNHDDAPSGEGDTNVEESRDKEDSGITPKESRSIQEEPKIQINALNEVPELKRIFKGYNMHCMTKTLGKYSMEMVREFYANYYYTLEKNASSKTEIKKEPMLDSVRVRVIPVVISERTVSRVLMGGDFTVPSRTTKYDYRMGAMKGIIKLSTEEKILHFKWMETLLLKTRREHNGSQAENRFTRRP
ncbi:hypothetical protein HAX54_018287 [Datura stramonium]|uniref:Uncharacterized protein n=1 Tax=Datura stramonium TaxID=4076 RepID=A0ABS8UNM5_DATST|nr:hypothetical protein [Datura stramonium]